MRILLWHVHGSWTTAFVQGPHTYLIPVLPGRGPNGRGRAETYDWPANAVEVTPEELADADVDLVILQRPQEEALARRWLRRTLPMVYVEHNTPKGDVPNTRHPMADRDDLVLVHVTHFNELFWHSGGTVRTVIEHGIPDPGHRYTGELPRIVAAINEPARRWRVTGTDLLPRFAEVAPVDVFGIGAGKLTNIDVTTYDDPPQATLHDEMARRRVYLHPFRWTSLGLSLLEAMTMGMPVVALATTEAVEAIPPDAGILSTQVDVLRDAVSWLIEEPEEAKELGLRARAAALRRYSLDRFLADWDHLLKEVHG